MKQWNKELLRASFAIARSAREHGNHPFGALLADKDGNVLMTAENTVVTEHDCTGHAETNLVRAACKKFDGEFLKTCTLYASTEPCPMCTGAIFWANIRRIVFGLGEERLYKLTGHNSEDVLYLPCKEVLSHGKKDMEVIGPVLENEAFEVHKDFWN